MEATKTMRRHAAVRHVRALVIALAAAGAASAWAEAMPADARLWMVHLSNNCWDHVTPGGSSLCAASDQFGAGGGIALHTYSYATSWTASFAQALPDRVHSYLAGWDAGFLYVSMRDTYTVHGAGSAPFPVTARLAIDGVAGSVWDGLSKYWLYRPYATAEIGTFDATTDPLLEQFRVTPFSDATTSTWSYGITIGAAVTVPFEVSTSHTRSVRVGDVFELGYGANITLGMGVLDLRDTARVSFDLPDGVWLTSQNGAIFGNPVPEPSTPLLLAAGLLAVALARRSMAPTR